MIAKACLMFLMTASLCMAQGYAGLGSQAEGFAAPQRGHDFRFPRDHGPHPEFRIEWWYVTANLSTDSGQQMGIQWTLFRSALAPYETKGWNSPQIWLGHAGLTTEELHFSSERIARGGSGQAGVRTEPFAAWIDHWEMRSDTSRINQLELSAASEDFSYALDLKADGPLVFHGDEGFSVKSNAGQASYYYSQPGYEVSGTVQVNGSEHTVTGQAWLDREWSSQPLASDQSGWDWFSLSFEDGAKLMAFVLRGTEAFTSGTWIESDGRSYPLPHDKITATPLNYAHGVPVVWSVTLPSKDLDVTVSALNHNSWMDTSFSYWEGPVTIAGSHTGQGYLEMTGYGRISE